MIGKNTDAHTQCLLCIGNYAGKTKPQIQELDWQYYLRPNFENIFLVGKLYNITTLMFGNEKKNLVILRLINKQR